MKKVAEGLILHELYKIEPMQHEASPSANDKDFYWFAPVQSEDVNPNQSDARMQGFNFLQNPAHDIKQLHSYAAAAKLFIKFIKHRYRLHRLNGCLEQQDKFCCHVETVCKMTCLQCCCFCTKTHICGLTGFQFRTG